LQSTHVWNTVQAKHEINSIQIFGFCISRLAISTVEMASREIQKPKICILFISCLAWTVNANSLKQNTIVIKEICRLFSYHLGWMNRRFCLQTQQRQRPDPQRLFASLDVEQICFQKTLLYIDIFWKDPGIQIFQSVILTVTIESRSCQALIADICTVAKS